MLKSPNYGPGLNEPAHAKSNEVSILTGQSKDVRNKMKKSIESAQFNNIENAEGDEKLNQEAKKMILLMRNRNKSIVDRNKRRSYADQNDFKRWVGSSINFNEPDVEKIHIK